MSINEQQSLTNKSIDEVKAIVKEAIENENVALTELRRIVDIMIDATEAPRSASRKIKDVIRGLHLMKPFMEMMQSSKDIIMKGTLDINMKQKVLEKIEEYENNKKTNDSDKETVATNTVTEEASIKEKEEEA